MKVLSVYYYTRTCFWYYGKIQHILYKSYCINTENIGHILNESFAFWLISVEASSLPLSNWRGPWYSPVSDTWQVFRNTH